MSEDVIGVKAVLDLSQWTPNAKKLIDDTGNAEKSMDNMAKSFNDKLRVVENSIGAVTAAYVVFDRAISQGEGVIQGKALFTAMAGGARQAAAGEEELQRTTRGLVDDQIAMAGASKLLSLGLVDNTQQAADLVGVGAQLGKVFMGDAGAGINAFNQIMANESPRGLAQFGISVDAVQKKMKDLEAQGISTREAFRMAVLDEARGKLDKLGDSVVMAGTAMDRLKIAFQDKVDTVLERAAQGFEGLISGINAVSVALDDNAKKAEVAGRAYEEYNRIASQNPLTSSAVNIPNANNPNQPPSQGIVGSQQANVTMAGQLVLAVQQYNEAMAVSNRLEEMRNANIITARNLADAAAQRQNLANNAEYDSLEVMRAANNELIRQEQQRAGIQEAANRNEYQNLEAIRAANNDIIRQEQGRANIQAAVNAAAYSRLEATRAATGAELVDQQTAADQIQREYDTITRISQQVIGLGTTIRGSFRGQSLFTDQEAFNAREIADAAKLTLQSLEAKASAFPNLVNPDDLTRMHQMVAATDAIAQNAQRGAQAFDSMNLAQLLGQTSGGPAGEIVNQIESFLSNEGQNVQNLQQIKDAMELVTGQQTAASEALQNEIVPALANISQSNATAAAQSAVAIQNYTQAQALAGKAVTEAGLLNAGGLGVNPNAGSRQITITAGMSATEAARANNITIAQLLATTGALNVNSVPTGTFTMNGGTAVLPLQGPGTTFGGGEGTLAQQGGLIAPTGPGTATGPGAPLVNGQQEITDAATNVQTTVSTTASVVNDKTVAMGTDMSTLNTTGQTQLTGPTGLTAWWDQLQTMVTNVYNTIMPLINNMQQGMTGINSAAQNLNNVPSNYANNTTVNPNTGRGYAVGGSISGMRLVGERGPELYTPSRAGYIVNAANTESILSALAGVLNGGGGNHVNNNQRTNTFNQYVTVQGNAQAASAMMGVTDALRGFG